MRVIVPHRKVFMTCFIVENSHSAIYGNFHFVVDKVVLVHGEANEMSRLKAALVRKSIISGLV